MVLENRYYRARIAAIRHYLGTHKADKERNSPRNLLAKGYVHEELKSVIDSLIERFKSEVDNSPLTDVELSQYSTYFEMYPAKVAGKTKITTSMHFPLIIDATKDDVKLMFESNEHIVLKMILKEQERVLALINKK